MIHFNVTNVVIEESASELQRLQQQFAQDHCVHLTGLLAPDLLRLIQARLKVENFVDRTHTGIGANKELCQTEGFVPGLLHFLLNNQRVFQLIEAITQCQPIGCFAGRVYRIVPGQGHHDAWHDDLLDHRLVALSINLSEQVYSGGTLQLRHQTSEAIVKQVPNTGFGDAILFRLAPWLKHRITDIEGRFAKTAYAGWFMSEPNLATVLKMMVKYQPKPI